MEPRQAVRQHRGSCTDLTQKSDTCQIRPHRRPLRWLSSGGRTMSAREFLTNLSIILSIMAVGALFETVVPMFAAREGARALQASAWTRARRGANLGLTAIVFLLNWLLTSIAALVALTFSLHPAGVMASLGLPFWATIILGVVVLDFSAGYLSHRGLHLVPALWRVHRIHHSDPFVDVTTTYRTHPV